MADINNIKELVMVVRDWLGVVPAEYHIIIALTNALAWPVVVFLLVSKALRHRRDVDILRANLDKLRRNYDLMNNEKFMKSLLEFRRVEVVYDVEVIKASIPDNGNRSSQ